MNVPHLLTLGEAAKLTGKSKTTIANAVKKGRVSGGNRGDNGEYQIDPAELCRVYPMINEAEQEDGQVNSQNVRDKTPRIDPALQAVIDAHKLSVDQLQARIDEKDATISDYKTRLRETKALTDHRTEEAKQAKAKLEEIEQAPKPVIKRRKVSLWDVIKNGGAVKVNEVEEVA